MPGSGRRRQAPTPLRRRLRLDLLLWGVLAGVAAALALGLTGGGWLAAGVLALLVIAGFAVLTVLTSTSTRHPASHPLEQPAEDESEGRNDTPDP